MDDRRPAANDASSGSGQDSGELRPDQATQVKRLVVDSPMKMTEGRAGSRSKMTGSVGKRAIWLTGCKAAADPESTVTKGKGQPPAASGCSGGESDNWSSGRPVQLCFSEGDIKNSARYSGSSHAFVQGAAALSKA